MTIGTRRGNVLRLLAQGLTVAFLLVPQIAVAQGLTGALVGTVTDAAGGVISGVVVRITSPALIGRELTTNDGREGAVAIPERAAGIGTRSKSSWKDFARITTPTFESVRAPPSSERLS